MNADRYDPVNWRQQRGRIVTPSGLIIGRAYVPPPQRIHSLDAQRAQAALLEPRTAVKQSLPLRIVGRVWNWL